MRSVLVQSDIEDFDVVKGVVPYVLQSLVKSDSVLPERLEKANHGEEACERACRNDFLRSRFECEWHFG